MTQPHLLGGRYEVGDLIGRGGMAEVHLATDTLLSRDVAVKILRSDLARDATFLARFRREALSSAGLSHPNIVAIYDSGEDVRAEAGGAEVAVPYIVMEYVPGKTLRQVLAERGEFDPFEAARITESVLDALEYSHSRGIVHRDIKPANVMVSDAGAVKVMDFGIARAVADTNATMTQTQVVIGTAQYLSPEQAHGQSVDARSDLYSTGCMLFELLTGRPPFIGETPVSIAYQQVGKAPVAPSTLNPNVWPDLDGIVLHSLGKEREQRYQTAADFREDLHSTRMGRPVSAAARAALAGSGLLAAGATAGPPGAPTEVLTLPAEPTEVYAAAPPPVAPPAPVREWDTATMEPIQRRDRSGAGYLALVLAVLATLGILGFGLKYVLDMRAADAALVAVPSVEGQPFATAQATLKKLGFSVDKPTYQASEDVEKDTVISQDPKAGLKLVPAESTVHLTVSSGPANVKVPDLTGRTLDEAKQILQDSKLTVGKITQVDDVTEPKGQVIGTDPGTDTPLAPGTPVGLRVSSGKMTVPNVQGFDVDRATQTLIDQKLKTKTEIVDSTEPDGTVLKQDPKAGDLVDQGSTVKLTVARHVEPTPSPTPTVTETLTQTPTPSSTPSPSPSNTNSGPKQ